MDTLKLLMAQQIENQAIFTGIIASNPRNKENAGKVKLRPVVMKDKLVYQAERFSNNKAYHTNLEPDKLPDYVVGLAQDFKQLEMDTAKEHITALVSKKGKVTIKRRQQKEEQNISVSKLNHNKTKQYILEEGVSVPFLVDLGVQTGEGRIVHAKYDKFRQINRYLEFVRDILPSLPKDRTLTIIDFGCGKSYLTFALYYYLKILNNYDIQVIGLDLKEDVIEKCNVLSQKYGYDGLTFHVGDISTYQGVDEVDMVVTLHACDTATDYALAKAVRWNARVILSVPCCQHELNRQIHCKELEAATKYGLIKERMAALLTDAIRADLLEEQGYDTQILEFIDMEHTPKNILIRAVKKTGMRYENKASRGESVQELVDFLKVDPTLRNLLEKGQA